MPTVRVNPDPSITRALAGDIVNQVESIVLDAESAERPLEVDPYRGRLFDLFARAADAGLIHEEAVVDLTADGLCRTLAERWDLADATRTSIANQTKLAPEQLGRMRLMWSVMRMWMEWTYAWNRWPEFH